MKDMERISKKLKNTNEFLEKLGKYLDENFRLTGSSGKQYTVEDWKKFFHIDIPDEINFMVIVNLAAEIFDKYQKASYFRDKQIIQMSILEQSRSDKYNTAYQIARTTNEEKFNKPLAAESCKVAATLAVKDLEDAISNQKVIKDFWNKTCDTLTELRKLVEVICRALSGDSYIQRDTIIKDHGDR
jgi:hypothetical protein